MKMNTIKAFLLFFLALLLIVSLAIFATVTIRNADNPDSGMMVQLNSEWTTLYEGTLTMPTDLTVNNSATSFYDVEVRLLSGAGMTISEGSLIIPSGHWGTFSNAPIGRYTIQARSADGVVREYTLKLAE